MRTIELLQHPVDGAGTAAAGHSDAEFVGLTFCHCDVCGGKVEVNVR